MEQLIKRDNLSDVHWKIMDILMIPQVLHGCLGKLYTQNHL